MSWNLIEELPQDPWRAANPFSTSVAGARIDGEGLNPLLQNYWMVIHPPCLYTGFVGCSVPFAFAVAALVTGRLDQEWHAGRTGVGHHRLDGPTAPFDPGQRLFQFVGDGWNPA